MSVSEQLTIDAMTTLDHHDGAFVARLVFRVHRPYFDALAADRAAMGSGVLFVASAAPGPSRLHMALRAIASEVGR